MDKDFEFWVYSHRSIRQPQLPMLTELLYRYCDSDQTKFIDLNTYLEAAFNAGKNSK